MNKRGGNGQRSPKAAGSLSTLVALSLPTQLSTSNIPNASAETLWAAQKTIFDMLAQKSDAGTLRAEGNTLTDTTTDAIELATELTVAWLSNPNTRVAPEDVPTFLKSMHAAVLELSKAPVEETSAEPAPAEFTGAVSVRKSLANPDFIISMIDGKPYKTLTRHLTTNGLTAAEYRARYNLREDYPMTAPNYSEARRAMALKIGLGSKGRQAKPAAPAPAPTARAKRGRPAKVVEPS